MSNSQWHHDQAIGERALRAHNRVVEHAEEMLAVLRYVASWCHQGHGGYPIKNCGLCKPVLEVIEKAKGEPA